MEGSASSPVEGCLRNPKPWAQALTLILSLVKPGSAPSAWRARAHPPARQSLGPRVGPSTEKAGGGEFPERPDARGGAVDRGCLALPGLHTPPEPHITQPRPACCPARGSGSLSRHSPWHERRGWPAGGQTPRGRRARRSPSSLGQNFPAAPQTAPPRSCGQLHPGPRPASAPSLCACHSTLRGPLCPSWVPGTQHRLSLELDETSKGTLCPSERNGAGLGWSQTSGEGQRRTLAGL